MENMKTSKPMETINENNESFEVDMDNLQNVEFEVQ